MEKGEKEGTALLAWTQGCQKAWGERVSLLTGRRIEQAVWRYFFKL